MYNELQAAILCRNTPLLLKILFTESTYAFLSYRKRKKTQSSPEFSYSKYMNVK